MPFLAMRHHGVPPTMIDPPTVFDLGWWLTGGLHHPTVFKTYRNARGKESLAFMKSRGIERRVFWFDVKYLPEVIDEEEIAPLILDQMTELEHAERQVKLWVDRYEELAKQEGPPQRVGSNVRAGDDGKRKKPRKRRPRGWSNVQETASGSTTPR